MIVRIIPNYILWHYTLGLAAAAAFGFNLVRFLVNFFSLGLLAKTLFAPWRRLGETYARGLQPNAWFETLIVNTLMRLIGVIIRLSLIAAGLVVSGLAIILALLAVVLWLMMPVLFIGLMVGGLFLILD